MPKGNPNPSPETRFKPGQSGNPSGKSSEQLLREHQSAKIAAELTLKALSCLQEQVDRSDDPSQVLAMLLNTDTRGMIVEAQNRAHGTPKQQVDNISSDGSMTPPSRVELVAKPLKKNDDSSD